MVKDPGKAQVDARILARVKQEINQPRLTKSVRRALKGKSIAGSRFCSQTTKPAKAAPVKKNNVVSRPAVALAEPAKAPLPIHE